MWTRKIKFRAWDGEKIHYSFTVARPQSCDVLTVMTDPEFAKQQYGLKDWKLMQFIGVHDGTTWDELKEEERDAWVRSGKMPSEWSGREVYEGDIVTAVSQGYKGTFEVVWRPHGEPKYIMWPAWQNKEFWIIHASDKDSKHIDVTGRVTDPTGVYQDDGIRIIGNIYENPELRPKHETKLVQ